MPNKTTETLSGSKRAAAVSEKKENKFLPVLAAAFFPLAMVYHELLLHAFHNTGGFFTWSLLPIVFFAVAAGLLVKLLIGLLPCKAGRITALVLTGLWTVYVGVSYCCKNYFKIYFSLSYMFSMAGSVAADFAGEIPQIVREALPFLLLDLLPLAVLAVCRRHILPAEGSRAARPVLSLVLAAVCLSGGIIIGVAGEHRSQFTYNYNSNDATPLFGLTTSTGLELVYTIAGVPRPPIITSPDDPNIADYPQATPYEMNALDIPFPALIEQAADPTIRSMHSYFATRSATAQNEYTGMFEGKNLILITAEAFSPYVISPELTPTLYKLSTGGFVFDNYYQPAWGQSTTGGEFAVMTGLIPTWVNNQVSFYASHDNDMPFALGNQFRKLGYTTLAYHNNTYTYYDRHLTHPNLGYDYYGLGNGLVIDTNMSGPFSDLDMMEATVGDYVADYVENGTPFHTYYMTFSGHANWGWGHSMARKNRDAAEAAYPEASTMVKAYIAANLELEYALEYLVNYLDDAGILDDTVICLSTDHYPYAMKGEDYDYYPELAGTDVSDRDTECYRSTLIMYCSSMVTPVRVSEPCTAIDILPTLSNLFGLSYDARLLSGRDMLAPYNTSSVSSSMPIAVIPVEGGKSWATPMGVYEAASRTFTANPGVTVSDNYVERVNQLVENKYSYAKAIIANDYYRSLFQSAEAAE